MIRASLYAVAVIALGTPRRDAILRKNAPKALLDFRKPCAARRKASAARLAPGRVFADNSRPPDFFGLGASPSQEPNFFSWAHRLMSSPLSPTTPPPPLSPPPSSPPR